MRWNALGQLTSVANHASGVLQNTVSFTYDGFGRRVSKPVSGTTTRYIWDNDLMVGEYQGSGLEQVHV